MNEFIFYYPYSTFALPSNSSTYNCRTKVADISITNMRYFSVDVCRRVVKKMKVSQNISGELCETSLEIDVGTCAGACPSTVSHNPLTGHIEGEQPRLRYSQTRRYIIRISQPNWKKKHPTIVIATRLYCQLSRSCHWWQSEKCVTLHRITWVPVLVHL